MKTSKRLLIAVASAGLSVASALLAEMTTPRMSGADFDKKLIRDTKEIRGATPNSDSYAEVVQRILPSVVSIQTFANHPKRGFSDNIDPDELNNLPPMFRDFFEDWLGRRLPETPRERKRPIPKKPIMTGIGSGVILTADGYIITNYHVVDEVDELKVEIAGKSVKYIAKVIGIDPQTDVALIKIDIDGLTPSTIGDSAKIRVGDVVLAIGSPMGLAQSVTHGIISGLGRNELGIIGNTKTGKPGYENFIQTDAAINPGNSGGPLMDVQGRVIGLNTAIETRSGMFAGIGLAIPINMAISAARDLLEGGKVQRGFLGIEMDQLDASMAEYLGLDRDGGVIVNLVVDDSPAEKSGFHEGDAIITINGQRVTSPAQLRLIVSANHPGTEVKFEVVRYNDKTKRPEHLELTAVLKSIPDKLASKQEPTPSSEITPKLEKTFMKGVTIETLNDELRQDYKITEQIDGVIITSVEPESNASKVLEVGDVITQINNKSVKTVDEAIANKIETGDAIRLKIIRNGRTKLVIVKS
jgi:serine protease Do